MADFDHDILIAGAGLAGLIAAAALGRAGYGVALVDPDMSAPDAASDRADWRSTAFLQPSRGVLERAGLWDGIASEAAALGTMRIVDLDIRTGEVRASRDFVASDISDQPFGWNFPNWLLRRVFADVVGAMANVTLLRGRRVEGVLTRDNAALVRLSDGTRATARLLIGADGRNSAVRQALGIGVHTKRFGQKALAFAVTHPKPHENVSTEIHRTGGPFTLVPLPDQDGQHRSAVVWMERGPEAQRLGGLSDPDFDDAMTARSGGIYGRLNVISPRGIWPIITQCAERLTARRTALIAEAAHVLPPIGAQGLNQSIADIAALLSHLDGPGADPGAPAVLAGYARDRRSEVHMRAVGISALNMASMADGPMATAARAAGLTLLHDVPPVRRGLMRMGLGVSQRRGSTSAGR